MLPLGGDPAAAGQVAAVTIGSRPRVMLLPLRSLFVALNRARNYKNSARESEHLAAAGKSMFAAVSRSQFAARTTMNIRVRRPRGIG